MWNRRGELKQQTRRAVAVGQVDDVPVGAVKRQCVRYRKTYKLVLALAAGGNCKMIVKTAWLYKRHIYSRWARENLIFSLVPYVGLKSSKTLQLQGAHTSIIAFGEPIRKDPVGCNEDCDLRGTHRVVEHMLGVRMDKHKEECGMVT